MWNSEREATPHPLSAGAAPVRLVLLRAVVVSAVATALAGLGHHLSFGGTPSWEVRSVAAAVVFAAVVPWSLRRRSLPSHTAVMLGAQAVVGCLFEVSVTGLAVPDPDPVWVWGYLAAAVAAATILNRAEAECDRLPGLAGTNLVRLVALLFARTLPASRARRVAPLHPGYLRYALRSRQPLPLHGVLLDDTLARRGPPVTRLPA